MGPFPGLIALFLTILQSHCTTVRNTAISARGAGSPGGMESRA
jgi:hypothetical protein